MKRIGPALSIPSLALALSAILLPAQTALATPADNLLAVNNGVDYLNSQQGSDGQIAGFAGVSYWAAFAYSAAGTDPAAVKAPGGTSLLDYLKNHPPAAGSPATDYERDILAITAAGQNPYDFGGTNYVSALEALHSGSQIGSDTAVNDDIFGVSALVAAHVPNSDSALTDALSFVLAHQHADGGFSYTTDASTGSDVDDTAAALMALQAAKNTGLSVSSTAISKANNYMLGTKNSDGGFPYDPNTPPEWGGPVSNVSSTSWVVMALQALGDGSSTDSTAAQSFLRSQQQSDGSFPYTAPGSGDTSDTADAVIALSGGYWPLHIYDGPLPGGTVDAAQTGPAASPSPSPSPSPARSASPSPSADPSPSPTPQHGSVLGASTTAGSGSSGSGLLPATGGVANLLAFLAALLIGLAAGTAVYLRGRRRTHTSR